MRRRVLLFAAVLPLPLGALAAMGPGCDSNELESLCGFLRDPDNCVVQFRAETVGVCEVDKTNGTTTNEGQFLSRESLDVCFLKEGQVIFDPPLDLNAFPPTNVSFKFIDTLGQECGSATFSGEYNFSVTLDETTSDDGRTLVITTPESRSLYDVTCADGTTHHFNRLDTHKCDDKDKYTYAQLLPKAELKSDPGSPPPLKVDNVADHSGGYVSFSISYPPANPTTDGGIIATNTQAESITYFHCTIPPAAPLCSNGVRNGDETDVDCGGELCEQKCETGKLCTENNDCTLGSCNPQSDGLSRCN